MGRVKLLDCTLRDGGYVNDWKFGQKEIGFMVEKLGEAGMDFVEVGFLKNEAYSPQRTVFSSVSQIEQLLQGKQAGKERYAAMIEVTNPIPLGQLQEYEGGQLGIIRIIIWKRLLMEGYAYCKQVAQKGYQVCIQPARVDQYSPGEFTEMLKLFAQINPMAIYVVDSFGTQDEEAVMEYCGLAHRHLPDGCALGYHGHNNLGQAAGIAKRLAKSGWDRDLMIDGSVYGIGRGAGNLQTELIAKWMNGTFHTAYQQKPLLQIYDQCIQQIYRKKPWGYSLPYYLTASYGCNPGYADYYATECGLAAGEIAQIFEKMDGHARILFSKEKADWFARHGGCDG